MGLTVCLAVLTHSLEGYARRNATVASQNVISSKVVKDTVIYFLLLKQYRYSQIMNHHHPNSLNEMYNYFEVSWLT